MTTKSRLRNLALPVGLATLAAVLIGFYVVSYRNSVTHGAALVKVLVASRDIPAGTDGSSIAGGGYLKSQTVPRRAVVPGSIASAAPLTSKITAERIYQGQQVTFSNPDSVASYLNEESHGQLTITGDVFGYFTISTNVSASRM